MKRNYATKAVKTAVIEPYASKYFPYKLVWRYGKCDFRSEVFESFKDAWEYARCRLEVAPEMIADCTGQACTMNLD